jgi:hypothetical protein
VTTVGLFRFAGIAPQATGELELLLSGGNFKTGAYGRKYR